VRIVRLSAVLVCALLMAAPGFASDLAILRNGFTIRHESRRVIGSQTRLYTSTDRKNYVDVPTADIEHFETDNSVPPLDPAMPVPAASPAPVAPAVVAQTPVATFPLQPQATLSIEQLVKEASEKHKLDPDFITSVIHAESGFNARAISPKGARGLMQLMPETASKLGVANAFDPRANVDGGTRYLRGLLEQYNFDVPKALAAYNAGPHRVDKYRGIPPYYETQAYVARIIKEYNRKKLAEQKAAARANASKQPAKSAGKVPPPGKRPAQNSSVVASP
jgi:hypothetical protein